MGKTWTPEQERAIGERRRTLLLSASAGSGKTATLTERILRSLTDADAPADLSRMLVVTFTRAAAKELRDRIRGALSGALSKEPGNARLARQLLLLPGARISTIDSFCISLVRQNAEACGISPRFRMADPAEEALLARRVMEETVEDAYAGECRDGDTAVTAEEFCRLSDALTTYFHEKDLAALLGDLYENVIGFPEKAELLTAIGDEMRKDAPVWETRWGKTLREETEGAVSTARERYRCAETRIDGEGSDAEAEKYLPLLEEEAEGMDGILAAGSYEAARSAICGALENKSRLPSVRGKTPAGEFFCAARSAYYDALKKLSVYYRYTEEQFRRALSEMGGLHRTAGALLTVFDRRFAEEKRQAGICSFDDCKHTAHRLLVQDGSPTPLALSLREQFDAVYVDEYQDVDAVQHEIFEALSPVRGRFMVGDVKQSIYGFRGARPDIFSGIRRTFPPLPNDPGEPFDAPAATAFLTCNFRSDKPILDFANRVCGSLFRAARGEVDYRDEDDLVCAKADGERDTVCPAFTVYPRGANGRNAEGETQEVRQTADAIAELLSRGKKKDGSPVTPGDVAVLFRTRAQMPALESALRRRGVPVSSDYDRRFFLNAEILLVLCLLNAINNPHRDTYLAGLLLSPIYDFSLDELLLVRKELKGGTLYDAVRRHAENDPGDEKTRRFLGDLARFRRMAEGTRADRLLRLLYRETGLSAMAGKKGSARENLLLLYNYARRFEAGAFRGLYRFLHYVNEIVREGRTFDVPDSAADGSAVRLMTVHNAKGLQFPVTFLFSASSLFGGDPGGEERCAFDPQLGFGAYLRDEGGTVRVDNPVRQLIALRRRNAETEEEIRLLYVALTRPVERLIVSGATTAGIETMETGTALLLAAPTRHAVLNAAGWMGWLSAFGADSCEYRMAEPDGKAAEDEEQTEDDAQPEAAQTETAEAPPPPDPAETERLRKIFTERFDYRYPYAETARLPGKLSVSRLSPDVLDGTEDECFCVGHAPAPLPAFLTGGEERTAADRGTATHRFMQFCDLGALLSSGAEAELARLTEKEFLSKEDAALVRLDEVERFRRSPYPAEMLAAKELYREFRFHMAIPASQLTEDDDRRAALAGERVLVQGVMDCLYLTQTGGIVLLDYKTDRLTDAELRDRAKAEDLLRARHGEQLAYYAAAVKQIFGRLPDRALIYSLPLGDAVESDVNNYLHIISYGKEF